MSLLLDALKKAELAKQNATGQHGEGTPLADPASGAGLHLEPLSGNPVEPPRITRDRLPDITQPLEILSEDLPSASIRRMTVPLPASTPPAEPVAAAIRATPKPEIVERGGSTVLATTLEDQERSTARQLFEAKSVDYNPRRPFFIAVGALAVVGVAIAGYFAYQIAGPRPSYYTGAAGGKAPQRIATAPIVAPTPQAQTPIRAASETPTQTAPTASSAAVNPSTVTAQAAPTPPAAPQPAPATGATRAASPAPDRAPQPAMSHAAAPSPSAIAVTPATQRLDPGTERGWEALQAGDLNRAREEYLRAAKANPLDRDALLGLAAIDARNRDFESAAARYLRILEIDPRDPYAQAGVIALRGQIDPVQSESRLKNLLAQQPDAAFLNFALGNQYAAQNRWTEAQAMYFKAYAADPENPEYAFNLAVSLDHMRQPKLALEYYQRALALSAQRAVAFNKAQVEARIHELQR